MNEVKIEHCFNCLKQHHKPICGICAFLNGFMTIENDTNELWKIANKMWEWAVGNFKLSKDDHFINAKTFLSKNNREGYSIIGEFFDSLTLKSFLEHNKDNIISEFNKKVSDISVDDIYWDELEKDMQSKNDDNTDIFYIVPINTNKNKYKVNNMHWICFKKVATDYIIYNSDDRDPKKYGKYNYSEAKAKKRAGLDFRKNTCISNMNELNLVWENMYNRCHDLCFDFTKWAYQSRLSSVCGEQARLNFKQFRHSIIKHYKYFFNKSQFKILKVEILKSKSEL